MKTLRKKYFLSIALISLIALSGCKEEKTLTPEEAKTIAEEAYIYAYPMLDNYKTMYLYSLWEESPAFDAPVNTLSNSAELRTPKDTEVVRPNNDTYYSSAIVDLRREPLVLSVPAISDGRYYSFQLVDLFTHNFDYIGTRKTGFDAGNYLIAGPGWDSEKPEGIDKVVRTETNLILALARTQVKGSADAEKAMEVMSGFALEPLSSFLGTEAPPEPGALDFPPYAQDKVQSAEFISYLNFLLSTVKQSPEEAEMLERFSKIGIDPGAPFDAETLDPKIKEAIEAGIASALEKIESETEKLGEQKNGWMLVAGAFGDPDFMRGKYLTRAAAAMYGIYGNDLEEAYYPGTTQDEDGDPLDGSKHNYILHFDADRLPPVKAFWSLTMYKLPEQLLVENEIDRYKIGDATEGLQYNEDGSLDIYIQKDNPGKDLESNWLPAYDGPFSLQARFYWPEPEALNPLYVPPAVQKNDG